MKDVTIRITDTRRGRDWSYQLSIGDAIKVSNYLKRLLTPRHLEEERGTLDAWFE